MKAIGNVAILLGMLFCFRRFIETTVDLMDYIEVFEAGVPTILIGLLFVCLDRRTGSPPLNT